MRYQQIIAMVNLTIREAARDRSIYSLFFAGFGMLLLSTILGKMAVGGGDRIIQNSGFWILGLWGIFMILYSAAKNLKYDFENKAIYMILSRPVSMTVYLLGRLAGNAAVLFLLFISLTTVWVLLLYSWHTTLGSQHIIALAFIFGEWLLLLAVSLMISSFTTLFTHHFLITGLYIMGHLSSDMLRYANLTDITWLKPVFTLFYYVLPNLEALNFRTNALYGDPIGINATLTGLGVLLLWIVTAFIAAVILWERKKVV